MPPRRPPTPKSKQPQFLEPNKLRSDTYILQTLAPTIVSTPAPNIPTTITTTYNTGRPLRPASERGNGAATASQVPFEVRDRLTANPNQFEGAEVHRQHLMHPREIAVEMTVDKVRKAPSASPSQLKSKKRSAEDTKAEKDGRSSQPARKRRYNTAKRRAVKFDFPTEITRLILRCLISEHQTFESDLCTAVCFGLTCRTHWAIFRSIFSGKIPLLVQSPNTFNQRKAYVPYRLGDLLVKWMLPTYRPLPCQLLDGKLAISDTASISVYVSFAAYPHAGGEKDQRLTERMAQYRRNCFMEFYCIYQNIRHDRYIIPRGLNWFIPNPYRMGEEWYPATIRFLKHTIFRWKSDCHMDREYHWLNDKEEYTRHYQVWSIYKTWMIRDWVEAQPEAMAYKRSRGLGEDKKKVGMRDGFEMLKLVDVQTKEHKLRVKQIVDVMLRFLEGRPSHDC
ncbi:uncharacterized protein EAE97_008044 [Botrytis byssoidea]|uniref:Uncharacterized protein n=1 Tax=Botrytis byssoidea TaxID=139641 RepID=A0A9P5II19_9HELO|nr:uncharacterized protein EAE97_008044 [Botrytis byssoidea]KAF7936678.1 hypothetical protein EAE97_008044 [Botrytis byssoidea]